ncbi:hypothetical protein GN244_ATG18722 [Phytophthora infestans]|nr:hypothetical protein GN244_ATG18722 [Phytophthora infestans]
MQARHRVIASLLDENHRLRVELKKFEVARQQSEIHIAELQVRTTQAETAMALQLHRKETEWMAEYDGSVKALLGIIKYHEDETKQLKMEVKRLKAAAAVVPPSITRMARSTQTETLGSMKAAMRRNNVRFAKDEDDVATNKVERLSADAKTKASIARMQVRPIGSIVFREREELD